MGTGFFRTASVASFLAAAALTLGGAPASAWEPEKPVAFVVPAGRGGGADQMARFVQGIVHKHKLLKQPLIVVNKGGGAGAEGFLEMKKLAGDPHNIVISLSNLFTTPYATGAPFSWKDLTPVALLALDQFVLWVPHDAPYDMAKDYIEAIKAAPDMKFKMGGTGSKQEDQIITVAIEKLTGPKTFNYIPYQGGGMVAAELGSKKIDSSVNNPIEALEKWRAGAVRPLCIFAETRSTYKAKVTPTQAWSDIPTCMETGVNVNYQMLRGIFMPSGVKSEAVVFYVDLFKKIRETKEWRDFMEKGAFNNKFLSGREFVSWLEMADKQHYDLMKAAGFLAARDNP